MAVNLTKASAGEGNPKEKNSPRPHVSVSMGLFPGYKPEKQIISVP